jgi:hypothetical protein
MVAVNHNCRLLLATFLDLRLAMKCIYSPTIEQIDGGEGLNSRYGPSSNNSLPFFHSTYAWADCGCNTCFTTLISANK